MQLVVINLKSATEKKISGKAKQLRERDTETGKCMEEIQSIYVYKAVASVSILSAPKLWSGRALTKRSDARSAEAMAQHSVTKSCLGNAGLVC